MIHLILAGVFFLLIIIILFFLFTKTKEEKEYDKKLKESLDDEYIIDPETGAKLTLEQAQSGHWIAHDNETLTVPEEDIEKLLTEEDKEAERTSNYLKSNPNYTKTEINDNDIDILDKTTILTKYHEWTYSDSYKLEYCSGYVFFPAVMLLDDSNAYFENTYHESQIMYWIKTKHDFGHYYFQKKSTAEKLISLIKKDNNLNIEGYETITFTKSTDLIELVKIINLFNGQDNLEIEFYKGNIFIKNLKFVNRKDLERIDKIVQNIC